MTRLTDRLAAAYQRDLSQCVLCEWRYGVNSGLAAAPD